MSSDRFEGNLRNLGGTLKEAAGDVTGDTKTQFEGQGEQIAGSAQASYGRAKDAVQDATGRIGERASEIGNGVYEQAAQAGRYATQQIQEQPLVTLLTVATLGGILGYLIGRK
jgi:uncharacterized protein YjbJ (UPF0337 family)